MPASSRHCQIPATLCAGRLSTMTKVPRFISGIRCSASHWRKLSPVMGGRSASAPKCRRAEARPQRLRSANGHAVLFPKGAYPCDPNRGIGPCWRWPLFHSQTPAIGSQRSLGQHPISRARSQNPAGPAHWRRYRCFFAGAQAARSFTTRWHN